MNAGALIAPEEVFAASITPQGLAISPDGSWVGTMYHRSGRWRLGLFPTAGALCPREMVLPCGRPAGLTWDPSGSALAFFADNAGSSGARVFVVDIAPEGVSAVAMGADWRAFLPNWSPNGASLAFSATSAENRSRLFVASVTNREPVPLTTGEYVDLTPHFAPHGEMLAFRRGWGLWVLSLADGSERQLVAEGDNELHHGCFSPDGSQLVFQRNLADGSQVLIADLATESVRALTDAGVDVRRPSWSPTGRAISSVRNREQVVVFAPDGSTLWESPSYERGVLAGPSSSPVWAREAELLAFLDGDGNAWVAGPDVRLRQVTRFPEPPRVRQLPRQVRCPSTGGAEVPALLLEPEGFVPGRNPAVVWLHGGPWSEAANSLRLAPDPCYLVALLEAGFVVLLPDYRGSTGHGAEWEWVRSEERGVIDVDDVLSARRFLAESGLVAPDRVAVAGTSYGGYLTLMALARCSQEWAAAASLWGILDPRRLPSVWGLGDAEPPDLPERTPLALLDRMRVPLLILHGARDITATVEEVDRTREAVLANDAPCELHVLDDTHGLPLHADVAARLLVSFLRRHTTISHP